MLALLFLACGSQEILDSGLDDFDTEIRAAIEADIASIGATAFSMAVIREGEVVWSDGFGTHTKSGVPVTADTLFRVASLTKPMTAISVLQQVDDGCLDLDAPVDAYIEDFVMKNTTAYRDLLTRSDVRRIHKEHVLIRDLRELVLTASSVIIWPSRDFRGRRSAIA